MTRLLLEVAAEAKEAGRFVYLHEGPLDERMTAKKKMYAEGLWALYIEADGGTPAECEAYCAYIFWSYRMSGKME